MNKSQSSQAIIDSQLLQQIVKLKVELEKCRSQVESYKQIQEGYKKVNMRSQLMEKQLTQYQQIMSMFFDRVKKIMILLEIDSNFSLNSKGQYMMGKNQFSNDSGSAMENSNDSISFINLKTDHNHAFTRKVNKLNSLKTIAQSYLSNNLIENNVSFYEQDHNFHLIQNRIKGLITQNTQCKRTLDEYEKSSMNISLNIKQHEVIVKRLQSQIRMKDKQMQETQLQIGQLLKKIQEMKEELKEKQNKIQNYEQQQQHLIKTYEELQVKIQQLTGENTIEQQKKSIVRKKCQQLIEQLQTTDDNYLLNYLMRDPTVIKSGTQQSTPRSFNYPQYNIYQNNLNQNNEWFSQYGGGRHNHQKSKQQRILISNSLKNKHNFVFD